MKNVELTDNVEFDIDTPEPIEYSLSEIESSISKSTPLHKHLSYIIAQFILYDFELSIDESMIDYKSCKETDYYKIRNIFKKYRYPIFCSRSNITEFDVLIKLSAKNHIKNDIINQKPNEEKFMITTINIIAPSECTEPVEDIIIWVFNKYPAGYGIYNRRFNIKQIECDQSNKNGRDERKPVIHIHKPKISQLTIQKLPYGIIGKYILFKFMAKSSNSENVDVQYCGLKVCRI
eukprot:6786_1